MATPSIEVELENRAGDVEEVSFPARYEVCDRCEGCGTHLNPSIGEHAYTAEEFSESFNEEEAGEYFKRGGMYDVPCMKCDGKRVVLVADTARMTDEQKRQWAEHEERSARDAAERRAELRWGY